MNQLPGFSTFCYLSNLGRQTPPDSPCLGRRTPPEEATVVEQPNLAGYQITHAKIPVKLPLPLPTSRRVFPHPLPSEY